MLKTEDCTVFAACISSLVALLLLVVSCNAAIHTDEPNQLFDIIFW